MPVCGDLRTMTLADLLQWASLNQKTGVLEIERDSGCQRIELRKGWIGACSADDPNLRIGEFLISRGKLDRTQLHAALERQQSERKNLGTMLMSMGVLSSTELAKQLAARAEEMIQRMLGWEEAIFRFHEGAVHDPDQVELNLAVSDVLLRGMQRQDEIKRMRKVFHASTIVLEHTDLMVPYELLNKALSKKIFDAIDGQRTIAEILQSTGAAHFVVIKFLYRLYENGMVAIKEERGSAHPHQTLLDVPPPETASEEPNWEQETESRPELELNDPELQTEIEVARRLIARGEHNLAIDLLNATARTRPEAAFVQALIREASEERASSLDRYDRTATRVPIVVHAPVDAAEAGLAPEELFLMNLLEGNADLRSLRRLASLREAEVLATLEKMLDKGLIHLGDPEQPPASRSA